MNAILEAISWDILHRVPWAAAGHDRAHQAEPKRSWFIGPDACVLSITDGPTHRLWWHQNEDVVLVAEWRPLLSDPLQGLHQAADQQAQDLGVLLKNTLVSAILAKDLPVGDWMLNTFHLAMIDEKIHRFSMTEETYYEIDYIYQSIAWHYPQGYSDARPWCFVSCPKIDLDVPLSAHDRLAWLNASPPVLPELLDRLIA